MTRTETIARTLGLRGESYHGFLNFAANVAGKRRSGATFKALQAAYYAGRNEYEAEAISTAKAAL
jgi:hypothetical protein